jgi:hypothetical protein
MVLMGRTNDTKDVRFLETKVLYNSFCSISSVLCAPVIHASCLVHVVALVSSAQKLQESFSHSTRLLSKYVIYELVSRGFPAISCQFRDILSHNQSRKVLLTHESAEL